MHPATNGGRDILAGKRQYPTGPQFYIEHCIAITIAITRTERVVPLFALSSIAPLLRANPYSTRNVGLRSKHHHRAREL
jgi:hypothetical protein